MKRVLLIICTLFLTNIAIAQNSRLVKGFVHSEDGSPLKGATIVSTYDNIQTTSTDGGAFEISISPYAKHLEISLEGFFSSNVEIEGSYMVIRLAVNHQYAELKAQAEEQKRIAEQKEAEAKAKAEEQKRIAEQKEAEAKAKAEEQKKIAAQKEAEAKAKAEEQKRIAAQKEAEAKAKAEEQKRIAAQKEAEAKAKAEEQKKLAEQKAKEAKVKADKRLKDYAVKQSGFGSVVDLSYMSGLNYPFPSLGISYTAGYRFNNQIYLGAGAGANFNTKGGMAIRAVGEQYSSEFLNPSIISIPVFAYFRANFIDRRCSPFFAVTAGGNISSKQTLALDLYEVQYNTLGGFVNPQLGVNFRTTTKTSLYLAVGFQCFTAPSCIKFTGYNAMLRSALGYGLDLHFGLTF